jgi:hypothetical protein
MVPGNGMMVQNGMMLLLTNFGAKENQIIQGVKSSEWQAV